MRLISFVGVFHMNLTIIVIASVITNTIIIISFDVIEVSSYWVAAVVS